MRLDIPWAAIGNFAATWAAGAAGAIGEQLGDAGWFSRDAVREIVRLAEPVAPFNRPSLLAPLFGLAAALLALILGGVAISSLSTLLASLLGLGLLLTRVYGVTLEVGAVCA